MQTARGLKRKWRLKVERARWLKWTEMQIQAVEEGPNPSGPGRP